MATEASFYSTRAAPQGWDNVLPEDDPGFIRSTPPPSEYLLANSHHPNSRHRPSMSAGFQDDAFTGVQITNASDRGEKPRRRKKRNSVASAATATADPSDALALVDPEELKSVQLQSSSCIAHPFDYIDASDASAAPWVEHFSRNQSDSRADLSFMLEDPKVRAFAVVLADRVKQSTLAKNSERLKQEGHFEGQSVGYELAKLIEGPTIYANGRMSAVYDCPSQQEIDDYYLLNKQGSSNVPSNFGQQTQSAAASTAKKTKKAARLERKLIKQREKAFKEAISNGWASEITGVDNFTPPATPPPEFDVVSRAYPQSFDQTLF